MLRKQTEALVEEKNLVAAEKKELEADNRRLKELLEFFVSHAGDGEGEFDDGLHDHGQGYACATLDSNTYTSNCCCTAKVVLPQGATGTGFRADMFYHHTEIL
jgi:hypothetical protein